MAWKILLECGICSLPVRVSLICTRLGVRLCSYSQGYELIRRFRLSGQLRGNDGFLFCLDQVPIIFYNQSRPVCRQRFTVAHELGHLLLGHGAPQPHPAPEGGRQAERAANSFAADLLSPACVLRGLGVDSAPQIARLCDISPQAAAVRMDQLRRLYERDRQWMAQRGRSCFFLSPLEWRLYCRFEPYIRAVRAQQGALLTAPRPCGAARPAGG